MRINSTISTTPVLTIDSAMRCIASTLKFPHAFTQDFCRIFSRITLSDPEQIHLKVSRKPLRSFPGESVAVPRKNLRTSKIASGVTRDILCDAIWKYLLYDFPGNVFIISPKITPGSTTKFSSISPEILLDVQ